MTPALTDDEREHSARVMAEIHRQIAHNGGWLSFDRYMDLALYAPGLGYYSAGSAKLGPAGDFVTAPELSSLFSQCVAQQCAEVLQALCSQHAAVEILELGAGTGRMAVDLLLELERLDALPTRYRILEVSADLRERQRTNMATLPAHLRSLVVWLDTLPTAPLTGIILANEVLDALACKRFVVGTSMFETGVEIGGEGALQLALRPADELLTAELRRILTDLPGMLPRGYSSELCPRMDPWLRSLASCLAHGAIFLFDYGLPRAQYYHPARTSGTLRCHFKHHVHDDPLVNVGVQDITAWVDFTRVAELANESGLEVAGFATQAAFLLGTGIGARLEQAQGTARIHRSAEAQRLLLPGEMGEAFKAMALLRHLDLTLAGFQLKDLRDSL